MVRGQYHEFPVESKVSSALRKVGQIREKGPRWRSPILVGWTIVRPIVEEGD